MVLKSSQDSLETGEKAPDFELEDYRGQNVSLKDLDNYDGVLVVFMCNHCPYVQAQVDELKKLDEEFSSIALVGINPNAETHPDDSVEKMEAFVEENDLEFYYLADREQEVAEKYGAECTPDPFLLDW
ncbi:MAG: redoxin domain-containing protein, partial [Candidatus Nanohaloarchaea archaeon]